MTPYRVHLDDWTVAMYASDNGLTFTVSNADESKDYLTRVVGDVRLRRYYLGQQCAGELKPAPTEPGSRCRCWLPQQTSKLSLMTVNGGRKKRSSPNRVQGDMAVTIEKQTVYLGAGLKSTGWIVWDTGVQVGWDTDRDAALLRARNIREQQEHRDGE